MKLKHFPRYWPFVRGIHRSPVNCPHKGQWRGALMFSLICVWINGWVNNREVGDLGRHRVHYDVTFMFYSCPSMCAQQNALPCWARRICGSCHSVGVASSKPDTQITLDWNIWCDTVSYDMTRHDMIWHDIWYMRRDETPQHNTTQHNKT